MFRLSSRAPKATTSSRPTFRPTLEALEAREVPTTGITNPLVQKVEAALQEIPATLPNLQLNINTGNFKNGLANFTIIINDLNVLTVNAPKFASSSRMQIDVTQVQTGVQLFQDGVLATQLGDPGDGSILRSDGLGAIINGISDFLQMQSGLSNGNLSLS